MGNKLKILNVFGITPVGNGQSAGQDFFIPKFKGLEKKEVVLPAFAKSYNMTEDQLLKTIDDLVLNVSAILGPEYAENNELNLLQLYLCLDTSQKYEQDYEEFMQNFIEHWLVFDKNNTPGIWCYCNDHVKINAGIKLALDHDTCGIFFNKSGKGTKGWDIRACVIDEDYSGFVHMSLAYTKEDAIDCEDGIIYCGDKLTQLLILPVKHTESIEISEDEYNQLMDKSERGAAGFGSSDVKH